jgi:DNA segregation ATPase FtsK/SpoIIIE-like protein
MKSLSLQNSKKLNILISRISSESSALAIESYNKQQYLIKQLDKLDNILKIVTNSISEINDVINSKESPTPSSEDTLDGSGINIIDSLKKIQENNTTDDHLFRVSEFFYLPISDENQDSIASKSNSDNINDLLLSCINKIKTISEVTNTFISKCTEVLTELTNVCQKNDNKNESSVSLVDNTSLEQLDLQNSLNFASSLVELGTKEPLELVVEKQTEVVAEEQASQAQAEVVAEEQVSQEQTEVAAEEQVSQAQAEVVAEEQASQEQAEVVAEEQVSQAQAEVVAEEQVSQAQAEVVAEEQVSQAQAEVVAEEQFPVVELVNEQQLDINNDDIAITILGSSIISELNTY